jgi:hypothetical protein
LSQAAQAFTAPLASSVVSVVAGLVLDLGGGYGGEFAVAGLIGLAGLAPRGLTTDARRGIIGVVP